MVFFKSDLSIDDVVVITIKQRSHLQLLHHHRYAFRRASRRCRYFAAEYLRIIEPDIRFPNHVSLDVNVLDVAKFRRVPRQSWIDPALKATCSEKNVTVTSSL